MRHQSERLLSKGIVLVDLAAAAINRVVTVRSSSLLRSGRDVREEEDYGSVVHVRPSACAFFGGQHAGRATLINMVFIRELAFSACVLVFGGSPFVQMLVTRSSDVRRRRPMAAGRGCVSGQLLRLHGAAVGFGSLVVFLACTLRFFAPRSGRDATFRSVLRRQWSARSVHSLTSAASEARYISDWQ
uniref:Uncharacterized protein n=1 Tax=Plectus sambesii TaxID=2011161 RepID=A0A914WWP2_9BILA